MAGGGKRRLRGPEPVTLSHEDKLQLADLVQAYFLQEFDQELGRFDAEFLIDHLSKSMGMLFYNKGLSDARMVFDKLTEDTGDALYALEQPIDLRD